MATASQKPQNIYSIHNIEDCNFLSRERKMRLLGFMARSLDVEDNNADDDEDDLSDLTDSAANSSDM